MKTDNLVAIFVSIVIGYLMYLVMAPFFVPIFWAVVMAILFYPYYKLIFRLANKNATLASVVACLSIALFIIIPMSLIVLSMTDDIYNLYQWAENYIKAMQTRSHDSPFFIYPFLERYIQDYTDVSGIDLHTFFANTVKDAAAFMGAGLKGFAKSFAGFVIDLVLAFFTMFFLFKDGEGLLGVAKDLLPISEEDKGRIFKKTREVVYATIYGGVMVGAVQGATGGLAFWFLGFSSPILWGFVMFIFSFLPSVGTAMVWGPAAIYLFIIGSYAKGVILALWGALVIGLLDNLLRPVIVSGRTDLHPMLLFFSIIGAVNAFGFIGIIAGPIIISIAQAIIMIYHSYVKRKDTWAG